MLERISIAGLAGLNLLALWLAPWLTLNRETGARGAVLLLPDRFIDFTGRTEALSHPALATVLWLSVVALLVIGLAGLWLPLPPAGQGLRWRPLMWLLAGGVLVSVTLWGWQTMQPQITQQRFASVEALAADALASPSRRTDVAALETLRANPPATVSAYKEALIASGVRVRGLPYQGSSLSLAAFLSLLTGSLSMLFGLRVVPRLSVGLNRMLRRIAVPAAAIALALLAAAVVILSLQATALGRGVSIDSPFMYVVGRLDTLFFAYQSLFAQSLGTLAGLLDSLKFATPLIFTGLAVAFAFRVGLFNIGAPGQMVLGAIFAMLAGVYVPGPRLLVLPLAIAAAALGGGLWGALPGWLKARFGANEVINTILLNYIAYSLLLFLLSRSHSFAVPALRMVIAIGVSVLVLALFLLFPYTRARMQHHSMLSRWLGLGLTLLVMVAAGIPRSGDFVQEATTTPAPGSQAEARQLRTVSLELPFRVEGLDPKSHPLQTNARLQHLPVLLGADDNQGNVVRINYAALLALAVGLLALWRLPRRGWRWYGRALSAVALAGYTYIIAAWWRGWDAVATAIPPTQLNAAFVIALLCAGFMHWILWRTKWGYELRAVGLEPKAAEYGGASVARNVILAMTISGAFAGLTATHYVLGGTLEDYALRQSLPTNDGFDGIAVALLGYNTPLGVVLSAFLFGVLKNGGLALNIAFSDLTRDVVNMVVALVVLFIAARGFLPERLTKPPIAEALKLPSEALKETTEPTETVQGRQR